MSLSSHGPAPSILRLLRRKNVLSGFLFIAIALIGLLVSRHYPVGTALRMGTGYVPRLLLWILLLLGGVIAMQGLRERDSGDHEDSDGFVVLRPIVFVTAALVAFGLSIERLGLIVAIVLLMGLGSLASRELRFGEVLLTTAALMALALGIFIFGLGLTIPVWPDW